MKKKMITLILMTAMIATFTACGGEDTTTTSASSEASVEEVIEEASEDTSSDKSEAEVAANVEESTEASSEVAEDTSESVEEITEVASSEAVEEASVESSTAEEIPTYSYSDIAATLYAKSSVNVRSLPSTDGDRLGSLSTNQEVTVTGKCNETGWYRIVYGDGEGFVSNNYLVTEKINVNTNTNVATNNTTTEQTTTEVAGSNSTSSVDTSTADSEANSVDTSTASSEVADNSSSDGESSDTGFWTDEKIQSYSDYLEESGYDADGLYYWDGVVKENIKWTEEEIRAAMAQDEDYSAMTEEEIQDYVQNKTVDEDQIISIDK